MGSDKKEKKDKKCDKKDKKNKAHFTPEENAKAMQLYGVDCDDLKKLLKNCFKQDEHGRGGTSSLINSILGQGVSSHGQPAHGSHSTSDKAQAFLSSVSHNPQGQQALKTLAMSFATHDKNARKAAMQQLIKVGVSSAPGASPHPGTQAPYAGQGYNPHSGSVNSYPGQPQPYPPHGHNPQNNAVPYPGQAQPYPGQAQPYPGQAQPYPGQAQPYPGQVQPYAAPTNHSPYPSYSAPGAPPAGTENPYATPGPATNHPQQQYQPPYGGYGNGQSPYPPGQPAQYQPPAAGSPYGNGQSPFPPGQPSQYQPPAASQHPGYPAASAPYSPASNYYPQ